MSDILRRVDSADGRELSDYSDEEAAAINAQADALVHFIRQHAVRLLGLVIAEHGKPITVNTKNLVQEQKLRTRVCVSDSTITFYLEE